MSFTSSIDINARLFSTLGLFNQYDPVRRSKFSAKARKLLRSTGGWVDGQEILDASTGLAYNPSSGRIVPRARLYRINQEPRAKMVNDTRTFIDRQIDCVVCFVLALRASGMVAPETIETIKTMLKGTYVPHNKMRAICERFNLNVEVVGAHKNNTTYFKYGGDSPIIHLGLIAKHYF